MCGKRRPPIKKNNLSNYKLRNTTILPLFPMASIKLRRGKGGLGLGLDRYVKGMVFKQFTLE